MLTASVSYDGASPSNPLEVLVTFTFTNDETNEVTAQQFSVSSDTVSDAWIDTMIASLGGALRGRDSAKSLIESRSAAAVPGVARELSRLEFARLFTADERIAIRAAAVQSPPLADFYNLLELAGSVNLGNAEVGAAVEALMGAGLLTSDRAAHVLSGQAPASK